MIYLQINVFLIKKLILYSKIIEKSSIYFDFEIFSLYLHRKTRENERFNIKYSTTRHYYSTEKVSWK